MATRLISDRPLPSQPITVCIVSKLADIIHSNEVNPALTYDNIDPHKVLGVDRLSAPILSILPIIDIGHFKNRFADNYYIFFFMQTNILFTGDIIYW